MDIFDKCKKIIKDREKTYGDLDDSFHMIAEYWSNYLSAKYDTDFVGIEKHDVANMMALMKIARGKDTYHEDNYIDAINYLKFANDFEGKER